MKLLVAGTQICAYASVPDGFHRDIQGQIPWIPMAEAGLNGSAKNEVFVEAHTMGDRQHHRLRRKGLQMAFGRFEKAGNIL